MYKMLDKKYSVMSQDNISLCCKCRGNWWHNVP